VSSTAPQDQPAADSNVISLPQPRGTVSSDQVMKVIVWAVAIGSAVGGTAYLLDDRTKDKIETHAEHPHKDAVSKDVYVEHVKLADERHKESKAERKAIIGKLDTLLIRMPAPEKK
jgi:hypothetical protein